MPPKSGLIGVLFLLASCATPGGHPTSRIPADASFGESLERIRQNVPTPALGAMLIVGGRIEQAAVVGVRKWGDSTRAQVGDQFHLGSCTKAMTATLLAVLIEKGKVSWTSTLGSLFPEIPSMNSAFRAVTLEMLSAHRGGLTGDLIHFQGGTLFKELHEPALDPSVGRQLVAEKLLSAEPEAVPGSKFIYANAGYIILGRVIEKITGMSWEDAITQGIFQPLGMSSCGFGAPGHATALAPDEPWAHQSGPQGPIPVPPGPEADNPSTYAPAGSVHCSMADWGKFLSAHVDGFNHKPTPILAAPSFDKLHTSYPGQTYTFGGWDRLTRVWAGGDVLTHEGSNTLNLANVWLAPNRDSVLIGVSNIATRLGGADDVTNQAITALLPFVPK